MTDAHTLKHRSCEPMLVENGEHSGSDKRMDGPTQSDSSHY